MVQRASFLLLALIVFLLPLSGCGKKSALTKKASSERKDYTHPGELTVGDDGVTRREGEVEPFGGAVMIRDRDWNLRYFAYYQNGNLHGPEMKFWEDGKIRRNFDYENGKKVRHREWFENGNPKSDAMMVDGVAIGRHRTWFEDGSPRWSGSFVKDLQWDGHIIDHAPGGKVMWDAMFDKGRYVSGIYPESEQEKLIANGMLKPENAVFPRNLEPEKNTGSGDKPEADQ